MAPLLDLLITLLHWGQEGWRQVLAARERLFLHAQQRLAEFAEQQGERVLRTPGNPISLALTLASFDPAATGCPAAASGAAAQLAEQANVQSGQQEQQLQPATPQSSSDQQPPEQQQAPGGQQGGASGGCGASSDGTPGADPPGPGVTFLGSMLFNRCVSGTRVVARGKRQEVGGLSFAGYGAHTDAYPCDYLTVAAALGTSQADLEEFLLRLGRVFAEFRQRRAKAAQAGAGAGAAMPAPS